MTTRGRPTFTWMDFLWLLFLAGLAVLPPIREIHKQLTLLAIAIVQLLEGKIISWLPGRGRAYVVLLKILLAALLIGHTEQLGIQSSYYPIFYLPVVTAALYFSALGTIFWTLLASAFYLFYLFPALQEYELTEGAVAELALRNLFFFLAALIVNRFVIENRRRTMQYQKLAEELAETNRRLEQAQAEMRRSERLAALGQLSAGLAHEIRNPLGIIKGSAEMLEKKLPGENQLASELAGYISSEVNRLSALVGRFLDFARPLDLDRKPTDVAAVVERALKSAADGWQGSPVRVERNYANHLPAIPLDEGFCEQVFFNLIQNAYQAMGETGGTLRVKIRAAKSSGAAGIEVAIEDSGPGVAPELREQIFNPFFTTKKDGVGLGLSIVSKIVDEHGGTIRVAGERGQGASFRVFLPASGGGKP